MAKENHVSKPFNRVGPQYTAAYAQRTWGFKSISNFDNLSERAQRIVVCHNMDTLKNLDDSETRLSIIKQCLNKSNDFVGLEHLNLYITCRKINILFQQRSNLEMHIGESSTQYLNHEIYVAESRKESFNQENLVVGSSKQNTYEDNRQVESSKRTSSQENPIVRKSLRKTFGNKRTHDELDDSEEDEERQAYVELDDSEEDEEKQTRKKKSKIKTHNRRTNLTMSMPEPKVEPELPEEIRRKLEQLNGSNIKWLITKRLFSTDVCKGNNRFSMPLNQIDISFLRDDERRILDESKPIEVGLVGTMGEPTKLALKKWSMNKPNGSVIIVYNLTTGWYKNVVEANDLKVDQLVHVWSFREGTNLSFALVTVDE